MAITYHNPLVGILRLMVAHGGEIDNRIRFQKSAFILKHLGFADFARLRFSYHHFGPYSQQLSDVLHEVVAAELITETRFEHGDDHVRYTYRLTDEGQAWLSANNVEASSHLADYVQALKKSHWRTLELASTMFFLLDERSAPDSEAAFRKALDLKPQCNAYSEEARKLVADLSSEQVLAS